MFRKTHLIVFVVVAAAPAWAQNLPHTPAEEHACRGDAHRFCKEFLSDQFQVASCLQEHRDHVSRSCRTVLEEHGH
jgi:hypothetical protein